MNLPNRFFMAFGGQKYLLIKTKEDEWTAYGISPISDKPRNIDSGKVNKQWVIDRMKDSKWKYSPDTKGERIERMIA
jgi:hypothetical protein